MTTIRAYTLSSARHVLTLLALGLSTLLCAEAATAAPGRDAGAIQVTPLATSPIAQKNVVPVRGSDGRFYAVYELLVTNSVSKPAKLNSVQVLTPKGRPVARLSAKELIAAGALLGADRVPVKNTSIGPNESRVLYLNPSFAERKAVPDRLVQRFDVTGVEPVTGKTERTRYRTGATAVSKRTAPVLHPPLEGAGWLASNACCQPTSHVVAMFGLDGRLQAAERFAADWIQIGADGRAFHGDPKVLSNWVGYGAPVISAGAGVVSSVHNGRPEQAPQAMPTTLRIPELPGNDVEVRMKNGLTAVYAHLQKGSVAVQPGDRVKAGQLLGRLGNSGGSLAPHLHFHVVEGANAVTDDGYPNTFVSFGQTGTVTQEQLLDLIGGTAPLPMSLLMNPVPHLKELPLNGTINVFPTQGD